MIGIIGSDGFLGNYLHNNIKNSIGINRYNYNDYKDIKFHTLINANGNSKMYWANNNIIEDFDKSTTSVYKSINNFKFEKYIYISSEAVYNNINMKEKDIINTSALTPYGFHKYLSEQLIKKYCNNYLILRCSALLGYNLKKGIIYDIINNIPLYLNEDSKIQFINIREILNIINIPKLKNLIINVGGKGSVLIKDIYNGEYNLLTTYGHREMNVSYLNSIIKLNTSAYYVKGYL